MTLLFFLLLLVPDQKADSKAIEELHRKDIAATKAYDVEALVALWTDDIISMPPNGQPIIGKKANRENLEAGREQSKLVDILDYGQKWEEVTISGDFAYEWGTFRSQIATKANAVTVKAEFKVLRVLKRQADGGWRIHRSIWNEMLPSQPAIMMAPSLQPKKP